MSCGQIALERVGIKVKNYYASEINKHAIEITQKNYPDTIQLGDVKDINNDTLSQLPKIDLLIGGSPCQNLSRTVINRIKYNQGLEGKKSSLFYEYVRVFNWLKNNNNHDISFLLENVGSMSDEDKNIISETLDTEPYLINSNIFSAQDRLRYYWTDISLQQLPNNKEIVLKDIMLSVDEVNEIENKSRMNFWYNEDFEFHGYDQKIIATLNLKGHDILKRVYNPNGKCATLTTCGGGNTQKKVFQDGRCRKLLPIEYERLQTVPDNYTEGVSNTQRYNMLGNGWTVDVISHIFSFIN